MSKQSEKQAERAQAIEQLRQMFPPGTTVTTVLLHTSSSGMSRAIAVMAVEDGQVRNVSWLVAKALGDKLHRKYDGVSVGGCGMDMGFHLVYSLSATLYRDGFDCVGERCPSNDHSNGDRNYTPHRHSDGGYALRHSWL